jgi:ABC-type transporter Mla subunit MlaD
MSTKAHNAKIGLFVIVAVALLVAGVLAFGAKSYFVSKTLVETAIPGDVSGLSVGSSVHYRGVPIGQVSRIAFAWSVYPHTKTKDIIVEFEIEADLTPVPAGMTMKTAVETAVGNGLRAMVTSQGITGTSILELNTLDPKTYPPPPIDYTPRHLYVPSAPPHLTRLLDSLGKSLSHLQDVDFASISQGVTNDLASLHGFLDKLNALDLASVTTNANGLLVKLKGSSGQLNATIEDLQKNIDSMKLGTVGTNANGLVTELRASNVKLQTVLDHLGEAPIQQTVADLQQALQSLNDVLAELKNYPSGFLFGKPPPPVKGVQPGQP